MKTFADVKRRLTKGTKVKAFNHWLNKDFGIREVASVQTKAVSFFFERDGEIKESWLYFNNGAKGIKIIDKNTFEVLEDGKKVLTYIFV